MRVGRRLVWVDEALAPLAEQMDPDQLQALTVSIAAICGIEVFVWLKDIAGLSDDDAAVLQCWIAEILLSGGLDDKAPVVPSIAGDALQMIRTRLDDRSAT